MKDKSIAIITDPKPGSFWSDIIFPLSHCCQSSLCFCKMKKILVHADSIERVVNDTIVYSSCIGNSRVEVRQ